MSYQRLVAAIAALVTLVAAGVATAQPQGGGQAREACQADIQKLCPDAKPGPGGTMRQCIRDHFNALSAPCQSAIRARMQQRQGGAAGAGATPS
jgi:hypothetical protein